MVGGLLEVHCLQLSNKLPRAWFDPEMSKKIQKNDLRGGSPV